MPSQVTPEMIYGGLCFIGVVGMALNKAGLLRITFGRNGNGKGLPEPDTHPISPEAFSKINAINRALEEKYLTLSKHADLCTIVGLRLQAHITEELKRHTKEIIAAVKANGGPK